MKTKPVILLAAISALLVTGASAQQETPAGGAPQPPSPGAEAPKPPREGETRRNPGPREGDAAAPGSRREGDVPRPPGPPREGAPGGPREGGRGPGAPREGFELRFGEKREHEGDGPHAGGPRGERPGSPSAARTESRPYLGVMVSPLPPVLSAQLGLAEGFGLAVLDVAPDSPAAKAGVQKYDVIKLLNDQQIVDQAQLSTLVTALGKGKEVALTVLRKAQEQKLTATLGEHTVTVGGGEGRGPGGFGHPPGFGGQERPNTPDHARELQERMREMQRRLQEGKGPGPRDGAGKPGAAIDPERLLQEAQPAGGSQIRIETTAGTTTIDGAQAHLRLKDNTGEIEVSADQGRRVLTARDPEGKVIFTGPVNTDEERAAVPEPLRKKLEQIHIRQGANGISGAVVTTTETPRAEQPKEGDFQ